MAKVFDADKFLETRMYKLGGKEFDVSVIPAKVELKMYNNINVIQDAIKGKFSDETFDLINELIWLVLKRKDKDVTLDFVEAHMDIRTFNDSFQYVFAPLFKSEEEGTETEKKSEVENQ